MIFTYALQACTLKKRLGTIPARVSYLRLFHLHCIIGQIVADFQFTHISQVRTIVPICLELEYLTIILEELCEGVTLFGRCTGTCLAASTHRRSRITGIEDRISISIN